jgi:hypothetical protein
VLNKYPSIFTQNLQKIRGAQRVEKTIRSAKRKSEQLLETLAAKQSGVQAGILVNQDGIQISDQESQALMMMHNEAQNQHYNDNKVIKKLRKKLADQPEKTPLTPMTAPDANVVDSIIDTTLAVAELGSTIIVDTRKYIALMVCQPCETCGDQNPTNKTCSITCPSGFAAQCRITCIECNNTKTHSNEPDGVDLSMCAAAAGIAGGINHYALTRAFAMMGITRQSSRPSYNTYQQKISQSICKTARECTERSLHDVLEYLHLQNNNTLSVSFDVSWSHVRNANEASGEFIFQGRVPGNVSH